MCLLLDCTENKKYEGLKGDFKNEQRRNERVQQGVLQKQQGILEGV